MTTTTEAAQETAGAEHATKYTRNNPFHAAVLANYLLTGAGSEKETRHVELSLDEGMEYLPGDAVGILPENRREAVDEVLRALKFTGDERVLDHYKGEISLEEAVRTRLGVGKLARGSVTQFAKLAPGLARLKEMVGPENKARAAVTLIVLFAVTSVGVVCGGVAVPVIAAGLPFFCWGAWALIQRSRTAPAPWPGSISRYSLCPGFFTYRRPLLPCAFRKQDRAHRRVRIRTMGMRKIEVGYRPPRLATASVFGAK